MSNTKNVFQRLAEVRKTVPYLKKEQKGAQYQYVGSSDVLGALHGKINEVGLLLIPSVTKHQVTEQVEIQKVENKYSKQIEEKKRITYFTEIEMIMRWQNIDDREDYIDCTWYAQGVDIAGEKGVGKALTYGEKYFLLKFFNIATDKDDPDAFQQKQENKLPPKLIDGKQLAELKDMTRKVAELAGAQKENVEAQLITTLRFNGTLDHLPQKEFSTALAITKKWHKTYEQKAKEAESQTNEVEWGK